MEGAHTQASGMGGMRAAGDLVARMQMTRRMRLKEAKRYVAEKLGCTTRDLSDPVAMETIRRDKGLGVIAMLRIKGKTNAADNGLGVAAWSLDRNHLVLPCLDQEVVEGRTEWKLEQVGHGRLAPTEHVALLRADLGELNPCLVSQRPPLRRRQRQRH